MSDASKWKKLKLYEKVVQDAAENVPDPSREKPSLYSPTQESGRESPYLIARKECTEEEQKELLYRVLGPVFFGEKAAKNPGELAELFRERYGIDVQHDFYEGDEHYEEYLEAQEAISEGMSVYGGSITFDDSALARLAEEIWQRMEEEKKEFRRINTLLEE